MAKTDLSRSPGEEGAERPRCDGLPTQLGGDVVGDLGPLPAPFKLDPADGMAIRASADCQIELTSLAPGPEASLCPLDNVGVAVGHRLSLLHRVAKELCGIGVEVEMAERCLVG